MQSQWKNWYLVPSELTKALQRNSDLIFWSRLFPIIEISNHTSTGSHMFSSVKGHMSTILN